MLKIKFCCFSNSRNDKILSTSMAVVYTTNGEDMLEFTIELHSVVMLKSD